MFALPSRPGSSTVASNDARRSRERTIHLVNPLWDRNGGADRRTVDLYHLLSVDRPVRLWSEYRVDPMFLPLAPEAIRPWRHPRGGTVVVVGVYFRNGGWLRRVGARRIVVVYNTDQPERLMKTLRRIGDQRVQVIYTSDALRDETRVATRSILRRDLRIGLDAFRAIDEGTVLESFVEPSCFDAAFEARAKAARAGRDGSDRRFTVGRLSRDNPRKHHPSDPHVFTALASRGMHVRVMGGTSLQPAVDAAIGCGGGAGFVADAATGIELLPAGAIPNADFLSSLDAFYYRTHPSYFEAFGRVVLEAMLCGIPVVAENRGGYASFIRHGENGFLFRDAGEATTQLGALQADTALRERIGQAARETAQRLFRVDLPVRTRRAFQMEAST